MPLSEKEDPLICGIINTTAVSSNSLGKYILSIIPLVESDIKKELPSEFGVVFDGWSDSSIHYVAIFFVYIHKGEYRETLIACVQLMTEGDLSAQQHFPFLCETFSVYEKTLYFVLLLS